MSDASSGGSHTPAAMPGWASAALLIAGVTVIARIIGLLRFVVLSHTVGTTCLGDVYATANAIPNIVYELVVGGALVAVAVPLVSGMRERDPARVRQMVAALHGWTLLLLVPVTAVMYIGSTWVIDVLLGTSAKCPDTMSTVAVEMLWVFLLQIPIYGATVIAQGALQAHHRFFAPALAPAISSLVVIGSYLAYAGMAGDDAGSLAGLSRTEFWMLAGGTTLGVVALLAVQIPALARADLIVMPRLRFPEGRADQARTLAWSGALVVASQWVAYAAAIRWSNVYGTEGSALVFVVAWTLFLLPWSVLALPIATSTFPRLSALHARQDEPGAARATSLSLRAVIAGSAVGAAGLAAAATPLAVLMVEGVPGEDSVAELAALLVALSPGVLAYGVHGHLVRVLAAAHRAPHAAFGSLVGWAVGIIVAGVAVRSADDAVDVATSIGVGFSIGLVVAALLLSWAVYRTSGPSALTGTVRMAAGAGAAAAVVGWLGYTVVSTSEEVSFWVAVVQIVGIGLVAVVAVGAAAAVVDRAAAQALLRLRSRSQANVDG